MTSFLDAGSSPAWQIRRWDGTHRSCRRCDADFESHHTYAAALIIPTEGSRSGIRGVFPPAAEKRRSPSVRQIFSIDAILLEQFGAPVHFQLIDVVIVFKVPPEFEVLVLLLGLSPV